MRNTLPLLPRTGAGRQRFLMWIIAFMAFLASLAMVGALMVGNAIESWRATVAGVITVVVPAPPSDARDPQRMIDAVLRVDGVSAARAITELELQSLLAPWLPEASQANLPLPLVLEIVVNDADLDQVTAALDRFSPTVEVVAHERPMEALVRMGRSIQIIGGLIVLIVLVAAAGTVVFTTRASLVIHQHMIDLVHMMGSSDNHLAAPFRLRALKLGLLGGIIGIFGALFTLGVLIGLTNTDAAGLARAALSGWQWASVASIPLVLALIAMTTAHVTVLRSLAKLH